MQTESNGTWGECLYLSKESEVVSGSWAKARLANSNQKSSVLVTSQGSYLRGEQGEGPGTQGRIRKAWAAGEVMPGTYTRL